MCFQLRLWYLANLPGDQSSFAYRMIRRFLVQSTSPKKNRSCFIRPAGMAAVTADTSLAAHSIRDREFCAFVER